MACGEPLLGYNPLVDNHCPSKLCGEIFFFSTVIMCLHLNMFVVFWYLSLLQSCRIAPFAPKARTEHYAPLTDVWYHLKPQACTPFLLIFLLPLPIQAGGEQWRRPWSCVSLLGPLQSRCPVIAKGGGISRLALAAPTRHTLATALPYCIQSSSVCFL